MTPVRLEPAASRSRVKHSTTGLPLLFLVKIKDFDGIFSWNRHFCVQFSKISKMAQINAEIQTNSGFLIDFESVKSPKWHCMKGIGKVLRPEFFIC